MTDLRISIDDAFLNKLRINLGSDTNPTELVREALAVYNWAASERRKGRLIVSADESGQALVQLKYDPLDRADPRATSESLDNPQAA